MAIANSILYFTITRVKAGARPKATQVEAMVNLQHVVASLG